MNLIKKAGAYLFGYDATASSNRRRARQVDLRNEDKVLKPQDRDKIMSDLRDLRRNSAIVSWMIRKHLDYVTTFSFQCRTGNDQLDTMVENLMNWWSRPLNCDASGRFSLQQIIRMTDQVALSDGDALVMKVADGRIQLIEGDRVRTPNDLGEFKGRLDPQRFCHGILADEFGRPLSYALCDSVGYNSYKLTAVIPTGDVYHYGYFDRYAQGRGVSPLAAAINTFCDLYEMNEYALAKAKLSQLFALKFTRGSDVDGSDAAGPYSFDFGSGPQAIDLDPGDDATFLESDTPSTEFQAFMQTGIAIGLKALDIPFSFYDESFTNYSGARQALLQYEQSAAVKRQNVQQLLNGLTAWRLALFIADGQLTLPNGMTLDDVTWEWVPAGIPWIDPLKEANADAVRISTGTASRQEICRERGKDWFEVAAQLAAEDKHMKQLGIKADAPAPAEPSVEEAVEERVAEHRGDT